jgi:hypothetical protein
MYAETAPPLPPALGIAAVELQDATAAGTSPGATAMLPGVPDAINALFAPFTWLSVELVFVVVTLNTDASTNPPVIPRIATTVAA